MMTVSYLVLVRHGESMWNSSNRFTGWVDVPLSEIGIKEAEIAAKRISKLDVDAAFTSKLERAHETLLIVLSKQKKTGIFLHDSGKEKRWSVHARCFGKGEIPVQTRIELNERCYGRLQGLDKDLARKRFGKEQVFAWRRSFDARPPGGESLKDVYARAVPYFRKKILPELKKGRNVLVSAHGNSLRALIKYLDRIGDIDIPTLELPYAEPIVYSYRKGKLTKEGDWHTFDRPLDWHSPKIHKTYKSKRSRER